jgi:hypothetical protein
MIIVEKTIRKFITSFFKIFDMYPTSDPFITGDSFRSISKLVYDPQVHISYSSISHLGENSIIFVFSNDYMNFVKVRVQSDVRCFKIICHNSDLEFDQSMLNLIIKDDIVFAVNASMQAKNLIPIPIGLENKRFHNNGIVNRYSSLSKNTPYIDKIFYSFNLSTNPPVRTHYYDKLSNYDFSIGYEWMDNHTYLIEMSKYMFCFSPPGNGIDCHRTWESIAINVIPICLKSPLMEYFVSLGLPIWMIEDFSEIIDIESRYSLKAKYVDIMSNSNKEASYIDYWRRKITTRLY